MLNFQDNFGDKPKYYHFEYKETRVTILMPQNFIFTLINQHPRL